MLKDLFGAFLDLLYPIEGCLGCSKSTTRHPYFCSHCLTAIKFLDKDACIKCGKYSNNTLCTDCMRLLRLFDKGVCVAQYSGPIPKIIHSFKYDNQRWMAKPLGEIMAQRVKNCFEVDVVTAVPLHPARQNQRGYNQASLLAKVICESLGYDMRNDVLLRIKDTQSQHSLSRSQRKKNTVNAFKAKDGVNLSGLRVLIVDDVFTTGSTINQCAKELIACGAKRVYFAAFASGSLDSD